MVADRSIDADLQLAHQAAVFLVIAPYDGRELSGRIADDLEAVLLEALAHLRFGKRLEDSGVQARDDFPRCARGKKYALPLLDGEILEAGPLIRRDVGKKRRALVRGLREQLQPARLVM